MPKSPDGFSDDDGDKQRKILGNSTPDSKTVEDPKKKPANGSPEETAKEAIPQPDWDSDDAIGNQSPIYETESTPALNQALDPEDRMRSAKELQALIEAEMEGEPLQTETAVKENGKSEGGAPDSDKGKAQSPFNNASTPKSGSKQNEVKVSSGKGGASSPAATPENRAKETQAKKGASSPDSEITLNENGMTVKVPQGSSTSSSTSTSISSSTSSSTISNTSTNTSNEKQEVESEADDEAQLEELKKQQEELNRRVARFKQAQLTKSQVNEVDLKINEKNQQLQKAQEEAAHWRTLCDQHLQNKKEIAAETERLQVKWNEIAEFHKADLAAFTEKCNLAKKLKEEIKLRDSS